MENNITNRTENQLLIIGNGFDLHCGLKSSYINFFNSEINKPNDLFERDVKLEIFNLNVWDVLLKFYYYDVNLWCDIEGIVKKTLCSILSNSQVTYDLLLENYGSRTELNTPEDIIFTYCTHYMSINNLFFIGNRKEEVKSIILKYLFSQLNHLEKRFCQYLKGQVINNDLYTHKANLLFYDLTNLNAQIINKDKTKLSHVYVLSFNYTSPLIFKDLGSYNHVHGKLCRNDCTNCQDSSIIFGIDDTIVKEQELDEEQNRNYLKAFSKTYRTLCLNEIQNNVLPSCGVYNPLIIKFYGHSLNEADYSYFQSIFDYYNLYGNSNVSLEFYYSSYKTGVLEELTDAVYNLINQYGLTLNNKDQGKNLMHKLILEHRVRIKELPTEEIDQKYI